MRFRAGALPNACPLRLPRLLAEHLSDLSAFGRHFCRQLCEQLPADIQLALGVAPSAESEALYREILSGMPDREPEHPGEVVAIPRRPRSSRPHGNTGRTR
jgi:hypothetical protein